MNWVGDVYMHSLFSFDFGGIIFQPEEGTAYKAMTEVVTNFRQRNL